MPHHFVFLKQQKFPVQTHTMVKIFKTRLHKFKTYSSFHLLTSSTKCCRPRAWRVSFCSCQSFCSTTVCVAMPAWSTPGTHSVTWPHIRCLAKHNTQPQLTVPHRCQFTDNLQDLQLLSCATIFYCFIIIIKRVQLHWLKSSHVTTM